MRNLTVAIEHAQDEMSAGALTLSCPWSESADDGRFQDVSARAVWGVRH